MSAGDQARARAGVRIGLTALVLLATPGLVHANGWEGVAYMLATIGWVADLGLCIVAEALVYDLLFELPVGRAWGTSFVANFVSFVAGGLGVSALMPSWFPLAYLVILVAAGLDVTICVLMNPDRRRVLAMAVLANLISIGATAVLLGALAVVVR